jgi:hypothetical protein
MIRGAGGRRDGSKGALAAFPLRHPVVIRGRPYVVAFAT